MVSFIGKSDCVCTLCRRERDAIRGSVSSRKEKKKKKKKRSKSKDGRTERQMGLREVYYGRKKRGHESPSAGASTAKGKQARVASSSPVNIIEESPVNITEVVPAIGEDFLCHPSQDECQSARGMSKLHALEDFPFSERVFASAAKKANMGSLDAMRRHEGTKNIRNLLLQAALQSMVLDEDVAGITAEAAHLSADVEDLKSQKDQLAFLIGRERSEKEQLEARLNEAKEALATAESLLEAEKGEKEVALKSLETAKAEVRSEYQKGDSSRAAIEQELMLSSSFKRYAYKMGMDLYLVAVEEAEEKIPDRMEVFASLRENAHKMIENPPSFKSGEDEVEEEGLEISSRAVVAASPKDGDV